MSFILETSRDFAVILPWSLFWNQLMRIDTIDSSFHPDFHGFRLSPTNLYTYIASNYEQWLIGVNHCSLSSAGHPAYSAKTTSWKLRYSDLSTMWVMVWFLQNRLDDSRTDKGSMAQREEARTVPICLILHLSGRNKARKIMMMMAKGTIRHDP